LGSEQEPGPRGSPQVPQPPTEDGAVDALLELTAKTESCGASLWPWHFGHSAFWSPYTKASNWWSQALQVYSKMGIRFTPGRQCSAPTPF